MNTLEDKHWFLISDLASVVEMFTKNLSVLTILGLVLIFGTIWALWHTRFGLRLRSCGEAPAAAESLGVNVYRYKFIAVLISGCAGRAGWRLPRAGLVRPASRSARPSGRGYIGLAAMIFGNWRPVGLFLGSTLFGYTQALPFREGTDSLHALLLGRGGAAAGRGVLPVAPRLVERRARRVVFARAVPRLVPADRRRPARVHPDGAVHHDAAGARASPRNDYACPRPTGRSIARAPRGDRAGRSTGTPSRRAAVEAATHAYAPYSHFPVGAAAAGRRRPRGDRLQRRERGVRRRAVRGVRAWSPSCTSPAAAG